MGKDLPDIIELYRMLLKESHKELNKESNTINFVAFSVHRRKFHDKGTRRYPNSASGRKLITFVTIINY